MQWETKRVLLTVKAYPEVSKSYGEIVCIAGVTDSGEFIRLFPVPFNLFRGPRKIKKYSWLEVECARAETDYQHRKESYKVKSEFGKYAIKVVDESLTGNGRAPWKERSKVLLPLVSPSLEDLEQRMKQDKTSLGLVKVEQLIDFYAKTPVEEIEIERSSLVQKTLFGGKRTLLDKIPHIFYYKFKCSPSCARVHDMSIEDWEVFQSFRSWSDYYPDASTLWQKLKERYFEEFKTRNLHFFVGTHSRWPIWMIVGAYYPPHPQDQEGSREAPRGQGADR